MVGSLYPPPDTDHRFIPASKIMGNGLSRGWRMMSTALSASGGWHEKGIAGEWVQVHHAPFIP